MLQTLKHSIASGLMLTIGATIYLLCDNKYIGAILFTVALSAICCLNLVLFTGSVCYTKTLKEFKSLMICLLGNIIGCFLFSKLIVIAKPELQQKSVDLFEPKLNQFFYQTIILGVFCGVLMAIAVEVFRRMEGFSRFVGIFTCIPVFILSGFEHSIADITYFFMSGLPVSFSVIVFILCAVVGNSVGGQMIRLLWVRKAE